MNKIIDANIILRYLLGDNKEMSETAMKIIKEHVYTLPEILAEVVYVLSGVYKISRNEIAKTLTEFLNEIEIEDKEVMFETFRIYGESNLDFVDCILVARYRVLGDIIISFDKKLNNMLQ